MMDNLINWLADIFFALAIIVGMIVVVALAFLFIYGLAKLTFS